MVLKEVDGAPTIARIELKADGKVPGIDDDEYQRLAEQAKKDCPVSRALRRCPGDPARGDAQAVARSAARDSLGHSPPDRDGVADQRRKAARDRRHLVSQTELAHERQLVEVDPFTRSVGTRAGAWDRRRPVDAMVTRRSVLAAASVSAAGLTAACGEGAMGKFVSVRDGRLAIGAAPYRFVGANIGTAPISAPTLRRSHAFAR